MGVDLCGVRAGDCRGYPGFREPHLGARRSRYCVHLLQIWARRASEFRDEEDVCGLGYVDLWCFLRSTVAVPRQVWRARFFPLLGVSTKRADVGLVCPDGHCTARPSRTDTRDCNCEVALDSRSNRSVWGYRRLALHSWPWHYLLCVRPRLYGVSLMVSKAPGRINKGPDVRD